MGPFHPRRGLTLRLLAISMGIAVVAIAGAPPLARGDALTEAYAREAALLRAEKRALADELKRAEASAATARRALTASIDRLGAELARMDAGLPESTPSPVAVRERTRALAERDARMAELLGRMDRWLEAQGDPLPADAPTDPTDDEAGADEPARLPVLVDRILTRVATQGALRVEEREYFAPDGAARTGPVLRIGDGAAVSWAPPFAPLVGSADGTLRVVEDIAPRRVNHPVGYDVHAVVYRRDEPFVPRAAATASIAQRFRAGGPLMWVLVALVAAAALAAMDRLVILAATELRWRRVRARTRLAGATPMPAATRVLAAPLLAVEAAAATSRQLASERAAECLLALRDRLQARLSVLAVVAAVAPLVGLLGTVTGMIATFTALTSQGSGDPQTLSGGISEALITTQVGLTIAVPTILLHTVFKRWGARLVTRVEAEALARLHRWEASSRAGDGSGTAGPAAAAAATDDHGTAPPRAARRSQPTLEAVADA
ncbi:MAG: MotA/TolQ/ExbB proton channel family protein [Myxococcota bacterium]